MPWRPCAEKRTNAEAGSKPTLGTLNLKIKLVVFDHSFRAGKFDLDGGPKASLAGGSCQRRQSAALTMIALNTVM